MSTKESSFLTNKEWVACVNWLAQDDPSILRSLSAIYDIGEQFARGAANGFEYQHPLQGYVNQAYKKTNERVDLSSSQFLAVMHNLSSARRVLTAVTCMEKLSAARITQTLTNCISTGDLFGFFLYVRCGIEHTAHYNRIIADALGTEIPDDDRAIAAVLTKLSGTLSSRVYGTRIDWNRVHELASADASRISKSEYTYKKPSAKLNREAKTILNSVDDLGHTIPDIRMIYELCCEFAHPNVGCLMAFCNQIQGYTDKQGVPWVSKMLGMGPPMAFSQWADGILNRVAQAASDVFEAAYRLLYVESEVQLARLLTATQRVVRISTSNQRSKFDPYGQCPCGSGMKLKFCCLSTGEPHSRGGLQ